MINLPEAYVTNKFYQYSHNVKFFKTSNTYRGSCPSCKEGSSYGSKTRLNYFITKGFFCFNCQKSWTELNWIKEVAGLSYKEIMSEAMEYDYSSFPNEELDEHSKKPKSQSTLPHNSINLSDDVQIRYYSDNPVVKRAITLIKDRRLDVAINRCKNFYISLEDYIHRNRLCLPFYDADNKIRFFQTRAMYPEDEDMAKYLSKSNADKTVFGLNQIDPSLDYLFIFEGPIDSMFVKNGISMAGLQISEHQQNLLSKYMLHKKIWILDNQLDNNDVFEKNMQLVEQGETIFMWPKAYSRYKDLNELCCRLKLNYVKPEFFTTNAYSGKQANLQLNLMKIYK